MKKLFKYVVLPLVLLLAIYLILCVVGPKNFDTEQQIDIEAPPTVIYSLTNNLSNFQLWEPWSSMDSTMRVDINDTKYGVGASYNWKSKEMGDGSMKIVESKKDELVKTALEFSHEPEVINYSSFTLTPKGDETEVMWDFVSSSEIPFIARGAMFLMGAKSEMESTYRQGLKNLKNIAEKRAKENIYLGYEIKETMMPERNYIIQRQEVPMDNTQQFFSSNLGGLFAKVQTAGAEMDGMPSGLYFKKSPDANAVDMAAAVPVSEAISIEGVSTIQIPESKAVVVDYRGDYKGIAKAHDAINDYMRDHGYFQNPPVVEEYVTDPTSEKDPSKWLTKVIYYVSQ